MQRCKLKFSLIFLSTLGFAFACSDDGTGSGGGANETVGEAGETVGAAGETDDADGSEGLDGAVDEAGDGDGDGNTAGDGDGDGDGDGAGDGDGDGDTAGDGDGDTAGDGDGDTAGDGDGDTAGDGDGDGDGGNNEGGDGDGDSGGDGDVLEVIPCGNKIYDCGDTLDNDMDGLIDLDDPECTSPCDDDESSFKTDLPGQNEDCKSDCYFDENSGAGDDQCSWDLQCDPESPGEQIGCPYDEDLTEMACEVEMPQVCLETCEVPNGCDCFGCCEIEGKMVYLDGSPSCNLDTLHVEGACESCTFNESCPNPCEPENCEVCIGQDPDDLPPECMEPECPNGVTPCFDETDCGDGQFCSTGCCAQIV